MTQPTASGFLASLLTVERVADGEFEARLHGYEGASQAGTSFGGDLLGRAVLAASQSCGGRALHSLHATFLRPVPAGVVVRLQVAALSDGRRLARRRVELRREGRLLFEATASFAAEVGGPGWQEIEAPSVPPPETLPPDVEVARAEGWSDFDPDREEFAWGFVGRPWDAWEKSTPESTTWSTWLRPRQPLGDDAGIHAAALAFASDYLSQWCAARRLGRRLDAGAYASLDHALYVHRPAPWDEWWLFHDTSEVAGDGRVLWHRRIFSRAGALVASARQEGLIAYPPPP